MPDYLCAWGRLCERACEPAYVCACVRACVLNTSPAHLAWIEGTVEDCRPLRKDLNIRKQRQVSHRRRPDPKAPVEVSNAVHVLPTQIHQRLTQIGAVPAVLVPVDECDCLWQAVVVVNDELQRQ